MGTAFSTALATSDYLVTNAVGGHRVMVVVYPPASKVSAAAVAAGKAAMQKNCVAIDSKGKAVGLAGVAVTVSIQ